MRSISVIASLFVLVTLSGAAQAWSLVRSSPRPAAATCASLLTHHKSKKLRAPSAAAPEPRSAEGSVELLTMAKRAAAAKKAGQ